MKGPTAHCTVDQKERMAFEEQLKGVVEEFPIDLDLEVFTAYFLGILEDGELQQNEKREAIQEMLRAVVDIEGTDAKTIDSMTSSILEKWKTHCETKEKLEPESHQPMNCIDIVGKASKSSNQRGGGNECAIGVKSSIIPLQVEDSIKQRIVNEFGYQVVEVVNFDEEGQMIPAAKVKHSAETPISEFQNTNREQVLRKAQMERQAMKDQRKIEIEQRQHQKQLLLEKKEKERIRVSKKERRAGR